MGDRGGFVRSWMKQKNRLIKSDLGTLKDKDWKDAAAAINIMRTHPDFDSSKRRHRDMFALLDRLSKEIENENRKSPKKKNRKKGSKLPTGLLKEVMVAWKEHAFSLMPKEVREDTIERQIQAKKSLGIFSQMGPIAPEFVIKKLDRYFKMGMFKADIKIYDIVFRVMSFDPELGAPLADELFERLKKASSFDPSNGIHPTGKSVNEVIEIWAHSRLPKGPKQAEAYLAELKGWFARSNRKELKVGTGIYCAVMEAHSRSNEKEVAFRRIQELYNEMKEVCDYVDLKNISRSCQAVANCRHRDSADFVLNALQEELQSAPQRLKKSSTALRNLFHIAMKTLAREARVNEIEELLQLQEVWAGKLKEADLKPNAMSYSNLIWAHTRKGNPGEAEAVLSRMMKSGVEVKIEAWNGVLGAWAESGEEKSAETISSIIRQLEKASPGFVNTHTYNALLLCYCRAGTTHAAELAERLLGRMKSETNAIPKPDRGSYLGAVDSWCSAGRPEKAESLLKEFCRQGLVADKLIDQQHFSVVLEAWARSDDPSAVKRATDVFSLLPKQKIKPGAVVYTSLLSCWANSAIRNRWKEMKKIYDQMKNHWRDGDEFARPDILTFNVLLHGLGKSNPNDLDAEASFILREMKEQGIVPNRYVYNTLMSGLAMKNQPDEIEKMFQEMSKDFHDGNVDARPGAHTFAIRLQAWSQAGDPQMTSRALNEWIEGCDACLVVDEEPGTQDFNAVLQAWMRSGENHAAKKAEMGLRQMLRLAKSERFSCFPDKYSFNTVISAYAKSRDSEAGKKAFNLLQEMKDLSQDSDLDGNLQPNSMTYATVFQALSMSFGSSERLANELIPELLEKPYSFWENDTSGPFKSIRIIKQSIRSSNFHAKKNMLEKIEGLSFRVKNRLTMQQDIFDSD